MGLSVSAASLALSGNPRIPEVTRERVREAAEQLGYAPNGAARALRARRHDAIGLLVFDPNSALGLSFYSDAVLAVADEALCQEMGMVLVNARPRAGVAFSKTLSSSRIDGAVCIGGGFTSEAARVLERRGLPYIFIGKCELPGMQVPYVSTDYAQGARLATDHLLALGHRRIAVVAQPHDRERAWIRERIAGHGLALSARGLPPEAGPLLELPISPDTADDDPAWQARKWLKAGITAVFVADYGLTAHMLRALRLQRIDVPRQMAVVGFDDPPGAELFVPPLTAVRQPLAALGAAAARTVMAWAAGAPREPEVATLPATLVVRQSCGASQALNGHSRN